MIIVVFVMVKVQGFLYSYPIKGFVESVLTQQLTSNKKNQNTHLVDDFDCVFNCDDDRIAEGSARPNTQQSAKVASGI